MRTKKILAQAALDQVLIYDPYHLYYLTGLQYDVGERFIALLIRKNKQDILFLNHLFPKSDDLLTIAYADHEDPIEMLLPYLDKETTLGIDGEFPIKFMLPLINQGIPLIDISPSLQGLRAIKETSEYRKLKIASQKNDEMMAWARKQLKQGISEEALAKALDEKQSTFPLTKPSFPSMVLYREHAADPHGVPSDRSLDLKVDSVLIDMGGIFQNYASDMTRTFINKNDPFAQEIYEIVLQANKAAIESVAIGSSFAEVDHAARSVIEQAGYGEYFIHRTGHGIGLECHEKPDVSQNNFQEIEAGMCFSIEPGIYIPGKIGVRIEDLVFVHPDRVEVLNKYPKDLKSILI